MFKPHVTVACVVHAQGKFLIVEETINGKNYGINPPVIWKPMKLYCKLRKESCGKKPVFEPPRNIFCTCTSG